MPTGPTDLVELSQLLALEARGLDPVARLGWEAAPLDRVAYDPRSGGRTRRRQRWTPPTHRHVPPG